MRFSRGPTDSAVSWELLWDGQKAEVKLKEDYNLWFTFTSSGWKKEKGCCLEVVQMSQFKKEKPELHPKMWGELCYTNVWIFLSWWKMTRPPQSQSSTQLNNFLEILEQRVKTELSSTILLLIRPSCDHHVSKTFMLDYVIYFKAGNFMKKLHALKYIWI